MVGARLRTARFFVLQCYPTVSAVHRQCPFRFSVPQSAVHRPPSVPAPFLRTSVLSTPSECCPPSVPITFPRASERCPPPVPNSFLRASVLSTVYRQCPLRSSAPPLLRSSAPPCSPDLRALSTVCACSVPPCSQHPQNAVHRPPPVPNSFLRASVLSTVYRQCPLRSSAPPLLRALPTSERCPPSVPISSLRALNTLRMLSTVFIVSVRSVPPFLRALDTLRVLSTVSAQFVPPRLSALHCLPSMSAPFLRSSVLSTPRVLSSVSARCVPRCPSLASGKGHLLLPRCVVRHGFHRHYFLVSAKQSKR